MHPTDAELLQEVQNHDSEAFEILYERYASALKRHVQSIVHQEDAAADLVQEALICVWQRAEQWNGSGSVRAWLYRIATNLALNYLRSCRRRPQQPLEPPVEYLVSDDASDDWETRVPSRLVDSASLRPDVAVERAEEKQQFWSFVDDLPGDKSEVFRMVYESEMDLRSVAAALKIPEGTVKSRLYHSKRKLAVRWGEYDSRA